MTNRGLKVAVLASPSSTAGHTSSPTASSPSLSHQQGRSMDMMNDDTCYPTSTSNSQEMDASLPGQSRQILSEMETLLTSCESNVQDLLAVNRQWDEATQNQMEHLWDSKIVLADQVRTLQQSTPSSVSSAAQSPASPTPRRGFFGRIMEDPVVTAKPTTRTVTPPPTRQELESEQQDALHTAAQLRRTWHKSCHDLTVSIQTLEHQRHAVSALQDDTAETLQGVLEEKQDLAVRLDRTRHKMAHASQCALPAAVAVHQQSVERIREQRSRALQSLRKELDHYTKTDPIVGGARNNSRPTDQHRMQGLESQLESAQSQLQGAVAEQQALTQRITHLEAENSQLRQRRSSPPRESVDQLRADKLRQKRAALQEKMDAELQYLRDSTHQAAVQEEEQLRQAQHLIQSQSDGATLSATDQLRQRRAALEQSSDAEMQLLRKDASAQQAQLSTLMAEKEQCQVQIQQQQAIIDQLQQQLLQQQQTEPRSSMVSTSSVSSSSTSTEMGEHPELVRALKERIAQLEADAEDKDDTLLDVNDNLIDVLEAAVHREQLRREKAEMTVEPPLQDMMVATPLMSVIQDDDDEARSPPEETFYSRSMGATTSSNEDLPRLLLREQATSQQLRQQLQEAEEARNADEVAMMQKAKQIQTVLQEVQADHATKVQELNVEIVTLQSDNNVLQERLEQVQQDLENAATGQAQARKEIEALQADKRALEEDISRAQKALDDMKAWKNQIQEALGTSRSQSEESSVCSEESTESLADTVRSELASLKEIKAAAQKKVGASLQTLKRQLQEQDQLAPATLSDNVAEAIAALLEEKEALSKQVHVLKDRITSSENVTASLANAHALTQEQYFTFKAEADLMYDVLSNEKKELKQRVVTLEQERAATPTPRRPIRKLPTRGDATTDSFGSVGSNRTLDVGQETRILELKFENKVLVKKLAHMEHQAQQYQKEVKFVQKELNETTRLLRAMESNLEDLTMFEAETDALNKALLEEKRALQCQLDVLNKADSQEPIPQRVQQLSDKLAKTMDIVTEYEFVIGKLNALGRDADETNKQLIEEKKVMALQISELESQAQNRLVRLEACEKKLEQANSTVVTSGRNIYRVTELVEI